MPHKINIQGHRGARGYFPENTIAGFTGAVDLGIDTIELDVVISADNKIVVSHEAWLNEETCSMPDGRPVPAGKGHEYNLYDMSYEVIKKFDCGKRGHPGFPLQQPFPAYKPLLGEVIDTVESYTIKKGLKAVSYNLELKTEGDDDTFNPSPRVFVDLVYREIKKYNLGNRLYVQSFDVRLLRELKKADPSLKLGLLVENRDSFDTNIRRLGFMPDAYNPEFVLVDKNLVEEIHSKGIRIFTWTVNEKADISRMVAIGVDGIISDYPDRVSELINTDRT